MVPGCGRPNASSARLSRDERWKASKVSASNRATASDLEDEGTAAAANRACARREPGGRGAAESACRGRRPVDAGEKADF